MGERIGPIPVAVHGSSQRAPHREEGANVIHDRLAAWRPAIQTATPDVLWFGARCLAVMANAMYGEMTNLAKAWGYERQHLSAWLGGSWSDRCAMPMVALWQILTSPTDEARAAAIAFLRLLADHLGFDVTPRERDHAACIAEAAGRLAHHGGEALNAAFDAIKDGQITADERARGEQTLDRLIEEAQMVRSAYRNSAGGK